MQKKKLPKKTLPKKPNSKSQTIKGKAALANQWRIWAFTEAQFNQYGLGDEAGSYFFDDMVNSLCWALSVHSIQPPRR